MRFLSLLVLTSFLSMLAQASGGGASGGGGGSNDGLETSDFHELIDEVKEDSKKAEDEEKKPLKPSDADASDEQ
jgi:hypothetical protein